MFLKNIVELLKKMLCGVGKINTMLGASQKKKKLEKIIEKQKIIEEIEKQIEESKAMLNTEDELSSLAETEIIQLKEKEIMTL